jgi:hypothetical protein
VLAYSSGLAQINNLFNIINVIKTLRRVDELTRILLSKRQRKLMLRSNVLGLKVHHQEEGWIAVGAMRRGSREGHIGWFNREEFK